MRHDDDSGPCLQDVADAIEWDMWWQTTLYDQSVAEYTLRLIHHAQYLIDIGRIAEGCELLAPIVESMMLEGDSLSES